MLHGLARSLPCLGADVLTLAAGEDHRRAAEVSGASCPPTWGSGPCCLPVLWEQQPCLKFSGRRTGLPWVQGQRCLWLPGPGVCRRGPSPLLWAGPHRPPLVLWALETLHRRGLCSQPRWGPAWGDTSPRGHRENLAGGVSELWGWDVARGGKATHGSPSRVFRPPADSTGLLPNHSRPQPLWGRVLGCGCGSARAGAPSGRPASLIRCRAFRAGGHCRVCLCFVPFWGPAVLRSQWTMAVSPPSPPEGQSPGLLPAVPPRVTLRAAASWLLFLCGFFHASANVFRTEGPRLSRQRAAPPRPRSRGPGLPAKGAVALACVHRAQVP